MSVFEFDYPQAERFNRDINAGLYQKFYIETPVEDAEFEAADEAANMIEVTIQIVDPAGDPMEEQFAFMLNICTDVDGEVIDNGNVTTSLTTGVLLQAITADTQLHILTDTTGKAVIELTEAVGAATHYLGVVLPNGKYAVSDAVIWT